MAFPGKAIAFLLEVAHFLSAAISTLEDREYPQDVEEQVEHRDKKGNG